MIGIFDSGVGGMTVANAVEQLLPDYPLLYLGDIARSPYGTKSAATIKQYSTQNAKFLIKNGAKIIVIACNSASSVATDTLRNECRVPVVEVISPAVQAALQATSKGRIGQTGRKGRTGRIGIIGTRATIKSGIYKQQIKQFAPETEVFSTPCPLLVSLVEEGWINKRETKMILRRYLHSLKNKQLDTLVLGCTHYPLLGHLIQSRIGKKVTLIDSSKATAKYLKKYLAENELLQPVTGHTPGHNNYFVKMLQRQRKKLQRLFSNEKSIY